MHERIAGRFARSEPRAQVREYVSGLVTGLERKIETFLRGPGKVLRSQSPDMIEQEIWGYLLAHYAISPLICTAATSAGIDPDRVRFKRTIRAVRRRVADPAFSP